MREERRHNAVARPIPGVLDYPPVKGQTIVFCGPLVEHEFITVPGAGHGLVNSRPEDRKHATDRSVEWIAAHMK
jgi:dipeptidyl aminopeptidase/acylaminoacyl peptidase